MYLRILVVSPSLGEPSLCLELDSSRYFGIPDMGLFAMVDIASFAIFYDGKCRRE